MNTGPSTAKAAALLSLHTGPGFVLPNAWDAGSARILEQVGFPAIATTSAGIAWSCGVPDGGGLDRDTMLEHVARIVAAVGVPHLVKPEWVKPGAAVLDVGVTRVGMTESGKAKLAGDVDPAVAEVAGWLSPNPGGVGPMTRAMLLSNVVLAAERAAN